MVRNVGRGQLVRRRVVKSSIRSTRADGHDRGTASAGRNTGLPVVTDVEPTELNGGGPAPALLQAALEQLRLEGALFFRGELTEGFAFESSPATLADALHPGAE